MGDRLALPVALGGEGGLVLVQRALLLHERRVLRALAVRRLALGLGVVASLVGWWRTAVCHWGDGRGRWEGREVEGDEGACPGAGSGSSASPQQISHNTSLSPLQPFPPNSESITILRPTLRPLLRAPLTRPQHFPTSPFPSPLARHRMSSSHSEADCIFCKIIAGAIPSFKLIDSDKVYAVTLLARVGKLPC